MGRAPSGLQILNLLLFPLMSSVLLLICVVEITVVIRTELD